jgi:hypothetical protein
MAIVVRGAVKNCGIFGDYCCKDHFSWNSLELT